MRIFVPQVLEAQVWMLPARESDNQLLYDINGSRGEEWVALEMQDAPGQDHRPPRDGATVPWYSEHLLLLPDAVLDRLDRTLLCYGELLPLKADPPLTAFNATLMLAALEVDASDIVFFDNGDVMTIERHVFRPEVVKSALLFRLVVPGRAYRVSPIYIQEPMIERFSDAGAEELGFRLVWDENHPDRRGELIVL